MIWIFIKTVITATIIVLISEVAKKSDRLGSLIASLPMITIFVLIWMKIEKQDNIKISNHAFYTCWYVIPTLPMFLIFPILYPRYNFWLSLLFCCGITMIIFYIWQIILKHFGIELL